LAKAVPGMAGNRTLRPGIDPERPCAAKPQTGSDIVDIVRIIFAILLPPLGVFLQVGLGMHFWLNILLTILGYIPGIVHAVWIIARR
jgi:uncharacterized membrane protein YqaE (UPF0057 family)